MSPATQKKPGRPRSFAPQKRRLSVSLSEEVWKLLADYENKSAYIEELIRRDNQQYDDPSTFRQTMIHREGLEQATRDRDEAESRIKYHQENIDRLETDLESRKELKQPDSEAARKKVLEIMKKKRTTEKEIRAWFESRSDIRVDCGFKSPKEATDWVMQNMTR